MRRLSSSTSKECDALHWHPFQSGKQFSECRHNHRADASSVFAHTGIEFLQGHRVPQLSLLAEWKPIFRANPKQWPEEVGRHSPFKVGLEVPNNSTCEQRVDRS